jgi:hypothetical protein
LGVIHIPFWKCLNSSNALADKYSLTKSILTNPEIFNAKYPRLEVSQAPDKAKATLIEAVKKNKNVW